MSVYMVEMDDGSYRFVPHGFQWAWKAEQWSWKKMEIGGKLNDAKGLRRKIQRKVRDLKEFGYLLENRPNWCARYRWEY